MTETAPSDAPRLAARSLSHRKPTRFDWRPGAAERALLAAALDLPEVAALRFRGEILPEGRSDFRLEAALTASVVQSCIVTLAPVPAGIDETILRRYLADWQDPDGDEVEIAQDDIAEPLPEILDIGDIAREALALALPDYPRAPGAELGEAVFAEPGTQALRDDDLRPFAGLARLMRDGGENGGG